MGKVVLMLGTPLQPEDIASFDSSNSVRLENGKPYQVAWKRDSTLKNINKL
jgi:hypothetical protein